MADDGAFEELFEVEVATPGNHIAYADLTVAGKIRTASSAPLLRFALGPTITYLTPRQGDLLVDRLQAWLSAVVPGRARVTAQAEGDEAPEASPTLKIVLDLGPMEDAAKRVVAEAVEQLGRVCLVPVPEGGSAEKGGDGGSKPWETAKPVIPSHSGEGV